MKIVHKTEEYCYRFRCNHCGTTLEAKDEDFRIVHLWLFEYTCPVCKESRRIDTRLIKTIRYNKTENC